MEIYQIYSLFSICGFFTAFFLLIKPKEKYEKVESEKETHDLLSKINELEIKSSMNSIDIHKLYIENNELRNKLHCIYSNDLNENINYYKNMVSMHEKIEYIQKYILSRLNS
jgi:hypothetical protein